MFKKFFSLILSVFIIGCSGYVFADETSNVNKFDNIQIYSNSSTNPIDKKTFDADIAGNTLSKSSIMETVGTVINLFLGLSGSIAIVFIIMGGFTYLFSQGNPENLKKAQGQMKSAVFGIAVIASSYIIVNFVLDQISNVIK